MNVRFYDPRSRFVPSRRSSAGECLAHLELRFTFEAESSEPSESPHPPMLLTQVIT